MGQQNREDAIDFDPVRFRIHLDRVIFKLKGVRVVLLSHDFRMQLGGSLRVTHFSWKIQA